MSFVAAFDVSWVFYWNLFMNTTLQTLDFKGTSISIIDHNDEGWMTGEDIGNALGYKDPRNSIRRIFERNKDELEEYSMTVKLTAVDGKERDARVYNEEGVMLISMFSSQNIAKEFRRWAVRTLKQVRKTGSYINAPEIEERLAKLEQSLLTPPQAKAKTINLTGIDPNDILKVESILEKRGKYGISESEVYMYVKRNFVNQVTAKKILRLLVEEGNYKTHGMDNGNGLKLYYFFKDVEIV